MTVKVQVSLLLLVFFLSLSSCARSVPGEQEDSGSKKNFWEGDEETVDDMIDVLQATNQALFRLHSTVNRYRHEHQLSGANTQSILSDCSELTGDSKDSVRESLDLLNKIVDKYEGKSNGTIDVKIRVDESDLGVLRTDLSAALTDITTCTDEFDDELTDDSPAIRQAVSHMKKKAAKVSELLSKALSIIN